MDQSPDAEPAPSLTSPAQPVVLVTGASSGIGLAVAHRLASEGRHLGLLARGLESLEAAARECERRGAASVTVLPTDVSDDSAVEAAVRRLVDDHGRLDGVVSCAGVVAYGRLDELAAPVFDGVVATNLLGSANVLRHTVPHLRSQGHGSIVLVGSLIGHIAVPTMSAYTVSKWGVRALARQARIENRDRPGVSVGYVSLPGVDTPIYRQSAYAGGPAGRPPPVVWSVEKAAGVVVRALEQPRSVVHGGAFDPVTRFGFSFLPRVFDAWVGPLFGRLASDRSTFVAPTEGNVLRSRPGGNSLRGGHGAGIGAVWRSLARGRRVPWPGS